MIKNKFIFVRGFTLVELLVTSALFSVIISIAVGALFSAQMINIRLKQTQTVLDGVNLATELMVRDIRYGVSFYCDTVAPSARMTRKECPYISGVPGATTLIFKPAIPLTNTSDPVRDRVAYYLQNGVLFKREYPYGGTMKTYQLTSNDVTITSLGFFSSGLYSTISAPTSDEDQALITVIMSGVTVPSQGNPTPVPFSVQTSASSRLIDN